MIGIVLVTHGELGGAFINAISHILGYRPTALEEVSTVDDDNHKLLRERIRLACAKVNSGEGVLVFADVYGGSPANFCSEFVDDITISALAGVSLPMLLRALTHREEMPLSDLVELLINGQEYLIHKISKRSNYVKCI